MDKAVYDTRIRLAILWTISSRHIQFVTPARECKVCIAAFLNFRACLVMPCPVRMNTFSQKDRHTLQMLPYVRGSYAVLTRHRRMRWQARLFGREQAESVHRGRLLYRGWKVLRDWHVHWNGLLRGHTLSVDRLEMPALCIGSIHINMTG